MSRDISISSTVSEKTFERIFINALFSKCGENSLQKNIDCRKYYLILTGKKEKRSYRLLYEIGVIQIGLKHFIYFVVSTFVYVVVVFLCC